MYGVHVEWLLKDTEEPTEGYLMVADTLGVNRSTARGILTGTSVRAEFKSDHVADATA